MTAPVIRITETTEASEIARLLQEYRIKRVPVVRDGRVVGIVSRADLLHAFGLNHAEQHGSGVGARQQHGLLADVVTRLTAALVTSTTPRRPGRLSRHRRPPQGRL
jgi:CBS-domain-containing membrane protein